MFAWVYSGAARDRRVHSRSRGFHSSAPWDRWVHLCSRGFIRERLEVEREGGRGIEREREI